MFYARRGKVGVVTHGSIRVKTHQFGIMKPRTIKKYIEGGVLGHGASDNYITTQSQTWFMSMDD